LPNLLPHGFTQVVAVVTGSRAVTDKREQLLVQRVRPHRTDTETGEPIIAWLRIPRVRDNACINGRRRARLTDELRARLVDSDDLFGDLIHLRERLKQPADVFPYSEETAVEQVHVAEDQVG